MKKQVVREGSELNQRLSRFLGKGRKMNSGLLFLEGDYDYNVNEHIHTLCLSAGDDSPFYVQIQIDEIAQGTSRLKMNQPGDKIYRHDVHSIQEVIDFVDTFLWEKYPHKPDDYIYIDPIDLVTRKNKD